MSEQTSLKLLPLPEEFEYLNASEKVLNAWNERADERTIQEVLEKEIGQYSHGLIEPFVRRVSRVGRLLDPLPRAFGEWGEDQTSTPFALGALTGVAISRYVHQEQVPFYIFGGRVLDVIDNDEVEIRSLVNASIEAVQQGERGMTRMGTYALNLVKSLANEIAPENRPLSRLVFTRGCGYILSEALDYHIQQRGPEVADVIQGISNNSPAFDWNVAAALEIFDKN